MTTNFSAAIYHPNCYQISVLEYTSFLISYHVDDCFAAVLQSTAQSWDILLSRKKLKGILDRTC